MVFEPTTTPRRQDELIEQIDRLAAEVAQLRQELEQSHRLAMLGTVAGSIAHEFNNLLTPVLSYAQMALAAPGDQELTRKALRKTADGVLRASRVASAMLGFARDEDAVASASLRGAAEGAVACLGQDYGRRGIAIEVEVDDRANVAMRPIALQQVLLNLLLNAIEAVDGRGGHILIRSTWNNAQVVIEVKDNGRGIEPQLLPRIFEAFVTQRQNPRESRGTGLGLMICKRLVEEVGGRIEAVSELGVGTSFRITLPTA